MDIFDVVSLYSGLAAFLLATVVGIALVALLPAWANFAAVAIVAAVPAIKALQRL